jgi:two-component system CheB/CheR fusion protein
VSSSVEPPPPAEPREAAAEGAVCPIVGIGASAGGLAAFEAFFSALPRGEPTGIAYVLVQHLSPNHSSMLVDLVTRYTDMPVCEAEDGMLVQPDRIYIIPPNQDLDLVGGALLLTQGAEGRRPRLTIDHFFHSLARSLGEHAICVVLSGTGSDGTLGLRDVKGEGGLALVQTPESAEYGDMPRNAIATGLADFVLPPEQMPRELLAYVRHAFDPARPEPPFRAGDTLLRRLCMALRARTGHDFSQYKETTLVRRIERRMALHQVANPDEYLRMAQDDPRELEALYRDLLIGVTEFFRDPDAFAQLAEQTLPRLLAPKSAADPLRIWVCGCSTGEEAYSLAIMLYEMMLQLKRPLRIQIFATDIDVRAIEHGRSGIYPASIAANVSEERLARFFTYDGQRGSYRIQKHIRDLLVFSEQDVIRDPPFSKLDLISCRNLLIYLNTELQQKLMSMFHYALRGGGILFLGSSETVGDSTHLFRTLDRKWKIYERAGGVVRTHPISLARTHTKPGGLPERAHREHVPSDGSREQLNLRQVTERALLDHYAQAGVLVNSRGQILHIVGRTGRFLEPADGDASMNVLTMAREGLRRELTVALHKSVAQKEPVTYSGLPIQLGDQPIRASVSVRPVDLENDTYLVVLEQMPERPLITPATLSDDDQQSRIDELERDLRTKDEYLQSTLEEMETTNEELKSTNEEMQSVNEELQSTNEELETSKEELQSVNEELTTVNAELQDKVADLFRANSDMNNLLAGTGVGTVFVDSQLRIARFTPAATPVINLISTDVGRPLGHVATNLTAYDRMVDETRRVLDTLEPFDAEVQVKAGTWYLMRIHPYRAVDDRIEGAVLTFIDITGRRHAEESVRRSAARLKSFIDQARAGVGEIDLRGRYLYVNEWLCTTLGYEPAELLRRAYADLADPVDGAAFAAALDAMVTGTQAESNIDRIYVRSDGMRLHLHDRLSLVRDESGSPTSLLVLTIDPLVVREGSGGL